jgi:hypothetical protein
MSVVVVLTLANALAFIEYHNLHACKGDEWKHSLINKKSALYNYIMTTNDLTLPSFLLLAGGFLMHRHERAVR